MGKCILAGHRNMEGAIAHMERKDNPHGVYPAQIGAAEATVLSAHMGRMDNPHGVTAAQTGAAAAGHVHAELEARTGSLEARAGALEGQTGALNGSVGNLNARVGALEGRPNIKIAYGSASSGSESSIYVSLSEYGFTSDPAVVCSYMGDRFSSTGGDFRVSASKSGFTCVNTGMRASIYWIAVGV